VLSALMAVPLVAVPLMTACAEQSASDGTPGSASLADSGALFAGIPQQGNVLGDPAAPITLTEFSDLRCIHCKHFADATLPVLVEKYVRAGRLRIVFGNLPILGPSSIAAARMAAAVGLQGHMFEFMDAFYRDAPGMLVNDDLLRRIAGEIPGVNVDEAMAKRDSPEVTAQLDEARSMAQQFGVQGTPTFLLGKTGATPHIVTTARGNKPDTITGPIDEMLAHL
jgi:protein-disulfide isomerase